MKKLIIPILGFFLLIGCSNAPTVEQTENNQLDSNETEITEETNQEEEVNENEEIESEGNEEKEVEVENEGSIEEIEEETTAKQGGLLDYRSKVGNKMIYTNGEVELYVYKIIAANDEYVQITISIGGDPTTHIYKWTTTEITLVYEDDSPTNPETNILNEFEPMEEKIETLINLEGTADWKLVSESELVTVPFGTFENVYVIENITDEVADADTIFRKYYAPELGLIKETFEVTGKNGYKEEATLGIVE
ncbi:hypothetical protein RJD24_02685 [Bacillaceae bacterium IKA-2]|nr:hypothetical protein RJD24_02685 [Bacillaceae bacterium IKA-2]